MEIGAAQQKILGAMFLVLVICLSLFTFANSRKSSEFPPTVNQCPDFFAFDGTECIPSATVYPPSGSTVVNRLDIMSENSVYNSSKATSLCKKKTWAIDNNVTWDGITNNTAIVPC